MLQSKPSGRRCLLVLVLIVLAAHTASAWEWPKVPSVNDLVGDAVSGVKERVKEGVAAMKTMEIPSAESIKDGIASGIGGVGTALTNNAAEFMSLMTWVSKFRPHVPRAAGISAAMVSALVQHGFKPKDVALGLSTWTRERDSAIAVVIAGIPSRDKKRPSTADASESSSDADASLDANPLGELGLIMRVVATYGEGLGLSVERLGADATLKSLGRWNKTSVPIMGYSVHSNLELGLFATASVTPEQAAESNGNREGCKVQVALTFRSNAKILSSAVKKGMKLAGGGELADKVADLGKFSKQLYAFDVFFPMKVESFLSGAALPPVVDAPTAVKSESVGPLRDEL